MKDRGLRTFVTVLTGLAVLYFGSAGRDPAEGRVSNGVIVLALVAALLVLQLTKPGDSAAK